MKHRILLFVALVFPLVFFVQCGITTWSVSGDTLTIRGLGRMQTFGGKYPWGKYREKIRHIVIRDGVTSIGDEAFMSFSALTSVRISRTVTSLGEEAFRNCSLLSSVVLPMRVKSLGTASFRNCRSLSSVVFPPGLRQIGRESFAYCHSLTSISIPSSVTQLGREAFHYCSALTEVTVAWPNPPDIGNDVFFLQSLSFWETPVPLATLHVPPGSRPLYEKARGWMSFGRIE
ncbi:MAG: leucine-rich repeat domain-containing protein [Tannerellaceae bacterium]|jgi:hypothetical protein|nr:leucine-rich repeat domain-containing protein [Tannerellaceae bacterium]